MLAWLVGQQRTGRSEVMMVNAWNAGDGSREKAAVLGPQSGLLDRRSFLLGSAVSVGALSLGGCVTDGMSVAEASKLYGPVPDEKFPIPAADISKVDPKYYRRTVRYETKEAPGTIIVDPGNYYVYRIEGDGSATRYGANVGRDGFRWNGDAYVGRKSEWATWTRPGR
jgi:lipoprotein-anchoring transpeptidase ErfK/SrfK